MTVSLGIEREVNMLNPNEGAESSKDYRMLPTFIRALRDLQKALAKGKATIALGLTQYLGNAGQVQIALDSIDVAIGIILVVLDAFPYEIDGEDE